MIATIFIVSIAFLWLGYETHWLTIKLLVGEYLPDFPDRWFKIFEHQGIGIHAGDFNAIEPNYIYTPKEMLGYMIYETLGNRLPRNNGEHYIIGVSPNLDGVLCGKEWLDNHWNNLADYKPEISMSIGGVRYNMTIHQPAVIKDIMKVNKLSRTEKKALKTANFHS